MRTPIVRLYFAFSLLFAAGAAWAEESASLIDAISGGKPILNFRLRYENVDQANIAEKGEAVTLRSLVGWQTGTWNSLSGTLELIDVGRANDDYNDSLNGKTQYPVIADPDNTDVNQLYVDYTGLPNTLIRGGRQSIKLDKVRMIGNVEFRQVMQVFNGVTLENKSLPNTKIFAGYLGRVKTISTKQYETDTVLLNVNYQLAEGHNLIGYGYFQDQKNAISSAGFSGPAPTDTSNQITGLRLDGGQAMGAAWKLLYTAEYATQTDYADGDGRIDADYLRVGGGGQWGNFMLRVDYEQLGSNNGVYAFQTPLGTNHLYQGWADQFLVTPPVGLQDTFLTGSAKIEKATLMAEYHQLKADYGSLDFGDELDFSVAYPLVDKLVGKLEYADYQAGDTATNKVDVTKIWLTLMYVF